MNRSQARKSFTSMIIRVSGGRRLRLTLRPRPRISRALLALLAGALGAPAYALDNTALPQGGQVSAGQAGITQNGANMTINQVSNSAVLNWQSFNVGSQAQVEFVQPGSSAVALNQVVGSEGSQIHGQIKANGHVFLSNPNGVIFAPGSEVNVGGLLATTLSLDDQAFMQGQYQLAGSSQAEVSNAGQLNATGSVALVGATVRNTGTIEAAGDVALAAGQRVSLDLHGDGLLSMSVDASALRGQVENGAAIQAGNQVLLTAAAAGDLIGSVVNNTGVVKARGLSVEGGRISLSGGLVAQTGMLDASGAAGGQIEISAHTLQDAGQTLAQGSSGQGGSIRVDAEQVTQTSSAHVNVDGQAGGGKIHLQGGGGEDGKLYSSATLTAQGLGGSAKGGEINLTASSTQLRAAQLDASGQAGGGSIQVGGGWQGRDASVANAQQTGVNASTGLRADARQTGDGGTVVVWSDQQTTFAGHISATGGNQSGDGGQLEVSSKENLVFAGTVETASPFGLSGSLLLDPKNITISDAAALFDVLNLDDPNAGASNWFGLHAQQVGAGNIAVTAYGSDIGGVTDAGAAYLFDSENGALLSAVYGASYGDTVGRHGITVLSDGAYLIHSTHWNNGTANQAGAVTYGAADSGINGVLSASNSLVGSSAFDHVGGAGITALSDGSYVVSSRHWDSAGIIDVGAVTYGAAGTGVAGEIGVANSLIGSSAYDYVGSDGVTELSAGAYLVHSGNWDNGAIANAGAVTYGAAGVGVAGVLGEGNSLVGETAARRMGAGDVTVLADGAYLVSSPNWANGAATAAGAVTFGAADVGVSGVVSAANSLVGTRTDDRVGLGGVWALAGGAYVVSSHLWSNDAAQSAGAVTYGAAGSGVTGAVNSTNSLVGTSSYDRVGMGGVTPLSDGAYVVSSQQWSGTFTSAGAVTYGAAGVGISGAVTSTNSLVGTGHDQLGSGGVTALEGGAYVIASPDWDNADKTNAGALTYGAAGRGISGYVSLSNSLIGSQSGDRVSSGGVTLLADGAYVISSPQWSNGVQTGAGAVTYGAAGSGIDGLVSADNSLVGGALGMV